MTTTVLWITLGIIGGVVVLALAAIGLWVCVLALSPGESERARQSREAFEAEQRIAEIGHRAQQAIMTEALNRFRQRYGWE